MDEMESVNKFIVCYSDDINGEMVIGPFRLPPFFFLSHRKSSFIFLNPLAIWSNDFAPR